MTRLLALVWPELRQPDADTQPFDGMLDALDDLSPRVEAIDTGVALVDITGLEPMWGPERRIAARAVMLARAVTPLRTRCGIGDNRWLAILAARLARYERPDAPAILDMFWAGEEGGTAIADILFGDFNPGGRLPYTVYQAVADIPPMNEYDITKGFTYMYFDGEPDWVFGHGLSFTTFDYSNLKVGGSIPGGPLSITADIRNSGKRAGDEVVQLYVRDVEASVKRPKKQLMAFERISLRPGETRSVRFTVSPERLAFWDEKRKAWVVEPGAFEVMVGSSSADIRLKGEIKATTAGQWPAAQNKS